MDRKLVALKLLLDEAGIRLRTHNIDDRKTLQKAICLIQASGIDLGYEFNWYLKGPYSPALSDDYYNLTRALNQNQINPEDYSLVDSIKTKLGTIQDIFTPDDYRFNGDKSDWLELVASVWFLKDSGRSWDDIKEILKERKPHLVNYVHLAKEKLEAAGLV